MTAPNDYDTFARAHATHNESSTFNAGYERPTVLAMMGDVDGKHVLDAGCGAGAHAAELVARGARVTGLDASAGLLEIAAERLGPGVPLHRADLAEPLPFADATFDVVLASLVMHYLQDRVPTLAEFRRVLVPGGRLVFSTHHPSMPHPRGGRSLLRHPRDRRGLDVGGQPMRMRFWHRPLRAMISAIAEAGLTLLTLPAGTALSSVRAVSTAAPPTPPRGLRPRRRRTSATPPAGASATGSGRARARRAGWRAPTARRTPRRTRC